MFEKILANLPANPGLVSSMAFYARRIRKEESVRRMGVVFIALAFVVQLFAVVNPPKPTLAASSNDLINGGFSSVSELVADCHADVRYYRTIINYYGLNCANLAAGRTVSLNSISYNHQLFSMGWNPQGKTNAVTGKPTDEQPVDIPGINLPLYWRYLWSWDSYASSTYTALEVKSPLTGHTFFILYACGNLVSIGLPQPYVAPKPAPAPSPKPKTTPAPKPKVCAYNNTILASSSACKPCSESLSSTDTIACVKYSKQAADLTQGWSDANGRTALPSDKIAYTLTATNTGKAEVSGFQMQDDLSYVLDYSTLISNDGGSVNNNGIISWPKLTLKPGQAVSKTFTVQVKDPVPMTLPSTSDPEYYDHIMTNVYGNTINIHLPASNVVAAATAPASALPNTGPGTSLTVAAVIFIIAGYFYSRSRLLAREAAIVIRDNNGGVI